MRFARFVDCLLIVAVMAFVPGLAGLASPVAADKNPMVNLELRNTQIKDAIDTLFEGTGLSYTVDSGIVGKVVELKLKGVTLKQALDALCEAAGLSYYIVGGVYAIGPAPIDGVVKRPTTSVLESGPEPQAQYTPPPQISQAPPPQIQNTQSAGATPGEPIQEQSTQAVTQTAPQSGDVTVSQTASPIYYTPPSYPGNGGFGGYGGGGCGGSPCTRAGYVSYAGGWGGPIITAGPALFWTRGYGPPPPPGYVNAEVQRFLQTQYAIQGRQYVMPIY